MQQPVSRTVIERQLRERGINPTPQRLAVADVMLAECQHLSADQVIERLRQRGESVSKATVYNTLGLFARKGLVRELSIDPSRVVYDSNPEPHHHFYDAETGELTDIPASSVELARLPDVPDGASVEGVDVVVRIRRDGGSKRA